VPLLEGRSIFFKGNCEVDIGSLIEWKVVKRTILISWNFLDASIWRGRFLLISKWNINVVTIAFETFYSITTNYGLGLIGHFEMVKPIH
jgi:hypothetical protein